jgi:hypothetical protein
MKNDLAILILSFLTAISSQSQGVIDFGNNNSAATKISTNSVMGGPATGFTASSTNAVFYYALYYSQTATSVNGQTSAVSGAPGNYVFTDTNWMLAAYGTNMWVPGRLFSATPDLDGNTVVPGVQSGAAAQFVVMGWSANIGTSIAPVQAWLNNGSPTTSGFIGESAVSGPITLGSSSGGIPAILFGGVAPEIEGFTLGLAGGLPPPPPSAPVITTQPTNLTVTAGNTAMFTVTASGTPPPNYQWSFNNTNITGATTATLILTNVQAAQAGSYSVVVSNVAGSITSSNALLTVNVPPAPPAISSQTGNQVVAVGTAATFSVTATGTAPLSYFWSRNGGLIPNATNASYTLFNAQLSDSGSQLSCLVSNAFGTAVSTNMLLKVIETVANGSCSGAIVITTATYTTTQSTLQADSPGNPEPDCVGGFGHGVWYEFTAPQAGLLEVDTFGSDYDTGLALYTGSCGSLTEVACNDDAGGLLTSQVIAPAAAGTTYFILAGGYDSDAGNLVLDLNYYTPPVFTEEPTNLSVVVSNNAILGTTVSGSPPINFQWYFNNTPLTDGGRISGSATPTLTIANVQTNDGGNYQLVASNFVGATTSSVAVLTPVILPPAFIQLPTSQAVGAGSNVNFTTVVSGTPPFSYQWYQNGNPLSDNGVHIAGSMTASLTISNLTAADAGSYRVMVSNPSGSINASATLTVLTPPVITLQPVGRSVPPGLPTTFTAGASGIPAPGYQWLLNGTNIPGATATNYTLSAVGANSLGSYQLATSNTKGVVVSSNARLVV